MVYIYIVHIAPFSGARQHMGLAWILVSYPLARYLCALDN